MPSAPTGPAPPTTGVYGKNFSHLVMGVTVENVDARMDEICTHLNSFPENLRPSNAYRGSYNAWTYLRDWQKAEVERRSVVPHLSPQPSASAASVPPHGRQDSWFGGGQDSWFGGTASRRAYSHRGKGKGKGKDNRFVPPHNTDTYLDLDWLTNRDATPAGIAAPQCYPETPLGRLRELQDGSVLYYDRRISEQSMTEAREWEGASHLQDWDTKWAPVLTHIGVGQESRAALALLRQTSFEGHREACRVVAHLLKNRHLIHNPSRWLMTDIHKARTWLDRPPFDHPHFETWLRRQGYEGGPPPVLEAPPRPSAGAAAAANIAPPAAAAAAATADIAPPATAAPAAANIAPLAAAAAAAPLPPAAVAPPAAAAAAPIVHLPAKAPPPAPTPAEAPRASAAAMDADAPRASAAAVDADEEVVAHQATPIVFPEAYILTANEPPTNKVVAWDSSEPPAQLDQAILTTEPLGWNWCAVRQSWWYGSPGFWWVVTNLEDGQEVRTCEWHPRGASPQPHVAI